MTYRYFASLLVAGLVAALFMAPSAQAQTTNTTLTTVDGDEYEIEFIAASTDANGNQTWQYRVTETQGRDLSHWTLELCVDEEDIVSWSPTASDDGIEDVTAIGTDPTTGVTGIKWDVSEDYDGDGNTDADSRLFSFTISAPLQLDDTAVDVAVKTKGTATGLIAGPYCDAQCPAPQEFETSEMRSGTGYVTTEFTTADGVDAVTFTLLENLEVVTVPADFTMAADADSDLDGEPDATDADDDNDGTPDTDDADDDGDGIDDADEAGNVTYVFTGGVPPSSATFELKQKDTDILEARYFAIARSKCGTIALFDPVKTFAQSGASSLTLDGSYPNPFSARTEIAFQLSEAAHTTLTVYDVMGRKVATLVDRSMDAGPHAVAWNGHSDQGSKLASGVYFYRLSAGDVSQTKRVIIVR